MEPEDEDRGRRTPLELIEAPLRRPRLALGVFAGVTLAALALSFAMTKQYASSTLILVESDQVPESFVRRASTDTARGRVQTLRQEVMSRTRLERVIQELEPYPEMRGRSTLSQMVERMRAAIRVDVKGSDAFGIGYSHSDPAKAMAVANRLTSLFIEEASDARTRQAESTREFLEAEVQEAAKSLAEREEALRRFKERNMGHLPEQTGANLATLQRLQTEKQSVEETLRAARERLAAGEKEARVGTADAGSELTTLRAELAGLLGRYTDQHPDVARLRGRIRQLEQRLAAAGSATAPSPVPDLGVDASRLEVERLLARREELEQRLSSLQGRVDLAPRTEQELALLTRDYEMQKGNYLTLLGKKMDAEMSEKLEKRWKGEQFRVLDPGFLPEEAYFPNRRLFALIGMLVGLLLGIGAAVVAEVVDTSVKTVRELEATVPYPVLATLPHVATKRRRVSVAGRAQAAT